MRPMRGFFSFLVVLFFVTVPLTALAAPVEFFGPIVPPACNCPKSAPDWGCVLMTVNNAIKFAISIGVVIAVLVIAYAGILWMMSPFSSENRETGRTMLLNAVIGLLIALAGWLIVDFVMKSLYNSTFGDWNTLLEGGGECIQPKDGGLLGGLPSSGGNTAGGGLEVIGTIIGDIIVGGGGRLTQAQASELLAANPNISVTSSGNCNDRTNGNCTSLDGIQRDTLSDLDAVQRAIGRPIRITAGTEIGHSNRCHTTGACVDIAIDGYTGTPGNFNVANINNVIETARQQGRCPVFEPGRGNSCPAGVTRCQEVSWATGPHFSFYNC